MVIIKLLFTALNSLYLEGLSVLITVCLVTSSSRNSWREQLLLLGYCKASCWRMSRGAGSILICAATYTNALITEKTHSLCRYSRCSSKKAELSPNKHIFLIILRVKHSKLRRSAEYNEN